MKVFNATQGTIYYECKRRSEYPGVADINTVYVTAQKGDVIVVEVDTNNRLSAEPGQQIIKFNNYKYNVITTTATIKTFNKVSLFIYLQSIEGKYTTL